MRDDGQSGDPTLEKIFGGIRKIFGTEEAAPQSQPREPKSGARENAFDVPAAASLRRRDDAAAGARLTDAPPAFGHLPPVPSSEQMPEAPDEDLRSAMLAAVGAAITRWVDNNLGRLIEQRLQTAARDLVHQSVAIAVGQQIGPAVTRQLAAVEERLTAALTPQVTTAVGQQLGPAVSREVAAVEERAVDALNHQVASAVGQQVEPAVSRQTAALKEQLATTISRQVGSAIGEHLGPAVSREVAAAEERIAATVYRRIKTEISQLFRPFADT